jgi:DNA ligase-1
MYKRTSAGAVQQWQLEVDGNKYRTISGQIDGKKVTSGWHECIAKNIGKANATTDEDQCMAEVMALYVDKMNSGYFVNIEDIDVPIHFKPMLAKEYEASKIKYPVYSQPKLDGVRCIATANGLYSRNGKPLVSSPHILEKLQLFFEDYPNIILDGELYNHDLHDDFNQIISLVRQTKPTPEDLSKSKELVQYHVYDCYDIDNPKMGFKDRALFLVSTNLFTLQPVIQCLKTEGVHNIDSLDLCYETYMKNDYEGQIVRLDTPYENKRTKNLLKRKDFITEEFKIKKIEEGIGNRSGMAGRVIIELENGSECASGIRGTHEYCKQLLKDAEKYVNGDATIRFFNRTPDGQLRFPVCIMVYEGKRDL